MTMVQKTNMSLDNASQPFRPRHDELVPSRYALKVGDIDVLVKCYICQPRCWSPPPTRLPGRP